jgi:hypothetical protein
MSTMPLHVEDDLAESDVGDVLAGVAIDDADVVALTEQIGDDLEGDVPARVGVVELPVRVPLDDMRFQRTVSRRSCRPPTASDYTRSDRSPTTMQRTPGTGFAAVAETTASQARTRRSRIRAAISSWARSITPMPA